MFGGHVTASVQSEFEASRTASTRGLAERRPLPHRRPSGPSVGRAAALEFDASGVSDLGSSGVTTHVNKVHHVTTITQVARDLGERGLAVGHRQ